MTESGILEKILKFLLIFKKVEILFCEIENVTHFIKLALETIIPNKMSITVKPYKNHDEPVHPAVHVTKVKPRLIGTIG